MKSEAIDFIYAANWKMFKTTSETTEFLNLFLNKKEILQAQCLFFPPSTSLHLFKEKLSSYKNFSYGAQNCYPEVQGAFTGEISPLFLKDLGAKYCLVGHSERRKLFLENDELLAKKNKTLQEHALTPIFCVGETIDERNAGTTNIVLKRQMEIGLSLVQKNKSLIIAYEPVWAIGTGLSANSEQVLEAHLTIKNVLMDMGLVAPILYGGSVKPENAKELKAIKNVSGFLIGGASLEVESLAKIIMA